MYNCTGSHIIESNMSKDSNLIDHEIQINSSYINIPGDYAYIVQCQENNDVEGGFFSSALIYTESGLEENNTNVFPLAILIGLISAICFLFYIADKMEFYFFEDKNGEKIPIMKFLVYFVGMWLTVPLLSICMELATNQGIGISNTIFGIYKAFIIILSFLSLLYFLGFMFKILEKLGGQEFK